MTAPDTARTDPVPAAAATVPTSPFVVVGGDAALCEGDVCAVPGAPGTDVPLATPPTS
ncbi:hypothetical protein ATJ88_1658 [Isoptericola jiangsuensis]|uniref:Uncharacterized protein n=1 Tax=Isoptericola jiangsuensis TaxID=548579 RepID=A0A2A9EWU2_9MICO|nr:hypothetical protein [Isoptericola jiangsuensis]PFG42981.1 hypothetical protein ATJ88_1658 [Isoptericola jiangsuensis]